MRILILSDIHANLEALEASLAAAPVYDTVWNLGDLVGYGANPNEVITAARGLGEVFVRGNHDKACSGISSLEGFNPIAAIAAMWTMNNLTQENLAWLRALAQGPVRPKEVANAQCVHGSPKDEDEYLIQLRDAAQPLTESEVPFTFFGHTHIQGGFATDGKEWVTIRPTYKGDNQAEHLEMQLLPEARYLINPGSIGQPRDGDPRAAFALFDTTASVLAFYRIPYDIKAAQKRILDADLPDRLATRLSEGH
jgi:diadenosine tetraphosphatase ApaH/serine/threonine PP2A family protein phosphatase